MRRKWATFQRLSGFERGQLLRAVLLLPLTRLALAFAGFRAWQSVLEWTAPGPTERRGADAESETRAIVAMVRAAGSRGLVSATCVPQSQVLWFLLRRRGIDARIHVGVRRQADAVAAHAWVEWDGYVLNDTRDVRERYAAFGLQF